MKTIGLLMNLTVSIFYGRCIEFKCQESAFWYVLVVRCLSIKFSGSRILECSYIVSCLFR